MKKVKKSRVYVELTAVWGNDDAESTIKVSRRRWKAICAGAAYQTPALSWYEGQSDKVDWSFINGEVSIDGSDCAQYVRDRPVLELFVHETSSGTS